MLSYTLHPSSLQKALESRLQQELLLWGNAEKVKETFLDKVKVYVLNLIKVSVKRVHIQYEDCESDVSDPYTLGIVVEKLSWGACVDECCAGDHPQQSRSFMHKSLSLTGLSVYLNSGSVKTLRKLRRRPAAHMLLGSSRSQVWRALFELEEGDDGELERKQLGVEGSRTVHESRRWRADALVHGEDEAADSVGGVDDFFTTADVLRDDMSFEEWSGMDQSR